MTSLKETLNDWTRVPEDATHAHIQAASVDFDACGKAGLLSEFGDESLPPAASAWIKLPLSASAKKGEREVSDRNNDGRYVSKDSSWIRAEGEGFVAYIPLQTARVRSKGIFVSGYATPDELIVNGKSVATLFTRGKNLYGLHETERRLDDYFKPYKKDSAANGHR